MELDVVDLTGCQGGVGKRPASPAEINGNRYQKRAKEDIREEQLQTRTITAVAPSRTKRPLEGREGPSPNASVVVGGVAGVPGSDGCRRGDAVVGRGDGSRVLQSSDLENSVASISGALRWRSPVKPYKLPRLHGPRLPGASSAVSGIVDVGADADKDEEQGRQQQQHVADHQQRPTAGDSGCQQQPQLGATACGRGEQDRGRGQPQAPGAPAGRQEQQPQQQQHEWGRLFSALSLGGSGRGSQRTDPVWAAATSNRAGGGGSCSARSRVSTVPGADQLQGRGQTGGGSGSHALPVGHSRGGRAGQPLAKVQPGDSNSASAGAPVSEVTAVVGPGGGEEVMDVEESRLAVTTVTAPVLIPSPMLCAAPGTTGGAADGYVHAASGGCGEAGDPGAPAASSTPEPDVCEDMDARSPARVAAAAREDQPRECAPPAAAAAERFPRRTHGSVSGGGGFLAQEAGRLLAGSSALDSAGRAN